MGFLEKEVPYMAREKFQTLTEQMFYILLALQEERCGADIMALVLSLIHI